MRHIIAWDTETGLFGPGNMAPPLSCVTYQLATINSEGIHVKDPDIIHHSSSQCFTIMRNWLLEDNILVGQNVAYDLAVISQEYPELLPLVFDKLEKDEITDTMIRQQMIDIAKGEYRGRMGSDGRWIKHNYSLLDLTRRHTGRMLDKDEWRLRYGELRDIPIKDWPEGAIHYPKEDARATMDVYLAQCKDEGLLDDQYQQTRAAFWLHLTSCYGLITNTEGVEKLKVEVLEQQQSLFRELLAEGLIRKNGTRDTKKTKELMEAACKEIGKPVRLTAAGQTALDLDACEYSENDILGTYAEYGVINAVLKKDIPMLELGARGSVIHTRFGLAASGRTTSSGPNVQNIRGLEGIRECFVPRPGYVFAQSDYDGLELRTLAQVCITLLGHSELAKALNSGLDPHLQLASVIVGCTYEEALEFKKTDNTNILTGRKLAKIGNFGIPGGLGIKSLISYAANKPYKLMLSVTDAQRLVNNWHKAWPEMREYFAYINAIVNQPGARVKHIFSNRLRGGLTYTSACNTLFQGLGSDVMKNAGWLVSKACYVEESSPLYGSRIVNCVHDELICEVKDDSNAHLAAEELARLMILGASKFLPDVSASTSPLLMSHWSKEAKRVVDDSGRLQVWRG